MLLLDVIFGDVNANGKLSLSHPKWAQDNHAFLTFSSDHGYTLHGENVYTGYRYYDAKQLDTLFPFGDGLSYTKYEYDNLKVALESDNVIATLDVANRGKVDGKESVQIYLSQARPTTDRPIKELKGFTKIFIKADEKKTVKVEIPIKYATSYWHEAAGSWVWEADTYKVYAAASSRMLDSRASQGCQDYIWRGL